MGGKKSSIPSAAELRKYTEGNVDVDTDDDEEIDEDEAFDSADEKKYGHFFGSTKKSKKVNDSSSGSDSDDSDNSINSNVTDDSGIASDDSDDEGDGGEYMLSLLDKLTPASSNNDDQASKQHNLNLQKNIPESEFSSSVVKSSGLTMDQLMNGISDTKGFSKIQKSMKEIIHPNQIDSSEGKNVPLKTTLAPVSRVVSERTKRKVHYAQQKEDVKNWNEIVQQNRKAESLDFRPKNQAKVNKDDLVSKFTPETDFEKEIHAALEAVGADDESNIMKREQELASHTNDDLGEAKLTMEQYQARQGHLAKMRALMFYEEQKRHHMNKIKSKKYRKIRKNQRERLKDAQMDDALEAGDTELLNELKEKEEMQRMQERMSLAHKNTSKWAKRQLRRGKSLDLDTRRALSAQLQKGQDLKKKMNGIRGSNLSDDDDDDNDTDQKMRNKAKAILEQTETDIQNDANDQNEKKGLFKMSFMQKGIQKQRERAREEAKTLLEELEGNDDDTDSQDDYDSHDDGQDQQKTKDEDQKVASVDEISKVLPDGKLVVSSLEFGKSNSISVNGNIAIDINGQSSDNTKNINNDESNIAPSSKDTHNVTTSAHSSFTSKAVVSNETTENETRTENNEHYQINKENKRTASLLKEAKKDSSSNPWLSNSSSKRKSCQNEETADTGFNLLADAEDTKNNANNNDEKNNNDSGKTMDNPSKKKKVSKDKGTLQMSQEELVRRAFAAPTDVEVEEEFQKEKVREKLRVMLVPNTFLLNAFFIDTS